MFLIIRSDNSTNYENSFDLGEPLNWVYRSPRISAQLRTLFTLNYSVREISSKIRIVYRRSKTVEPISRKYTIFET